MNAILAFSITGCKTPCGTTIGADGRGDYFEIITGTDDECWQHAKKLLADVEKSYYIGPKIMYEVIENSDKVRFTDLTSIGQNDD